MASSSTDRIVRPGAPPQEAMADALRMLAVDAVQRAGSGHPGAPMGMAEMAVALWHGHLQHNPANPRWFNRDRFLLSHGHAPRLLYALLHLSGYALPLADLQRFRQLRSRTPGYPEPGIARAVEATTSPLGQGLSNAVGMALAEKLLADEFNRPGHRVVDHHTYVFVGEDCLMEGISHEACSLAGRWGLHKLVALYDDNGVGIDGAVAGWFREDSAARFAAYGWNVIGPVDGRDSAAVGRAIEAAKAQAAAPSLVICRTTLGRGSPGREGTAQAHGEPLGQDEIAATRAALGREHAAFEVPDDVAATWDARPRGAAAELAWRRRLEAYRSQHPALAAEFERRMAGHLPDDVQATLAACVSELAGGADAMATRQASQQALAVLAPRLPELLGGSADRTTRKLTDFPGCGSVRGSGLAGIMNGIALHGGYIPYGDTFLSCSDYSRSAVRMAALMKLGVVHVFTHDSICLGEDGPTHQPVEHAASLRLIPNLDVWRPADAAETAVAWASALQERTRPTALLLSRQHLPVLPRSPEQLAAAASGGYVLSNRSAARAVILATGSEVALALAAQKLLDEAGVPVRVVSLPSTTVFDRQDAAWRDAVLGHGLPRIGVEAGVTRWWSQYGCVATLGIDSFGESAPLGALLPHFGLTPEHLAERVRNALGGR